MYTLLQKVSSLQNTHVPTQKKIKCLQGNENRIFFKTWDNVSKEEKTASNFYNFSPIQLLAPVLNKNPLSQMFPHKTWLHKFDTGYFYRPFFWSPLEDKCPNKYLQSYLQSQEQMPEAIAVIKLSFYIIGLN